MAQPKNQVVGSPRPLPGLIGYGNAPQGPLQNTRFTGGAAPGGSLSLTHPETPPTFVEPQFAPGPSAALGPVQAPQVPSPLAQLVAAPSGATSATVPTGGPMPAAPPPPTVPQGATQSFPTPNITGQFGIPGATQAAAANQATNPGDPFGFVIPKGGVTSNLAALLANPAVGRRGVYRV